MGSSLLFQLCPACLVRLIWMVLKKFSPVNVLNDINFLKKIIMIKNIYTYL